MRKIWVSSSKKNSRERPNSRRKAKQAQRSSGTRQRFMRPYCRRSGSAGVRELVADAPRREDERRRLRIDLDLPPETADDGVNGPLGHVGVVGPHFREQRGAA